MSPATQAMMLRLAVAGRRRDVGRACVAGEGFIVVMWILGLASSDDCSGRLGARSSRKMQWWMRWWLLRAGLIESLVGTGVGVETSRRSKTVRIALVIASVGAGRIAAGIARADDDSARPVCVDPTGAAIDRIPMWCLRADWWATSSGISKQPRKSRES
jgi:hypothetical protein